MPTGSSSENTRFHSDYRRRHETSSTTINSVSSARSNQTSEYHIGSDLPNDRDYSNSTATDPSRNIILAKFFNSTRVNGSAYENVCSSCGYGVFEARGKLCNFCQYVLNGYLEDNSNIYENIFDKCSELCGGGDCLVCSKNTKVNKPDNACLKSGNKSTSKKLKKRLFNSLLGSLKRVKSFNVPGTTGPSENVKSPIRKLQIVHNVDGYDNVFRTNETFDLGRICELKQLKTSTSDHHIYGKLRKIDDPLQVPYECIKQKSQSDDYLIGGIGSEPFFRYNSIDNHSGASNYNNSQSWLDNDSSSCLRLGLDVHTSVSEWMTSLRCETHDYYSFGAPDTVLGNPKSIPGHFGSTDSNRKQGFGVFGDFGVSSYSLSSSKQILHSADDQWTSTTDVESQVVRLRSCSDESGEQLEFEQQMVNEFKRSLMEKQESHNMRSNHLRAKRQGIYLKLDGIESEQSNYQANLVGDQHRNSNCLSPTAQPQFVTKPLTAGPEHSRRGAPHQLNKRCCIYEKDSEFVSDILQAFDSFLHRDSEADVVEESELLNSESSEVTNEQSRELVSFEKEEEKLSVSEQVPSLPIDIEEIIHILALTKGLNRIVVCYDFPLKVFLSGIDKSPRLCRQSVTKLSKLFRRFQVFLSTRDNKIQTSAVLITDSAPDCQQTNRSLVSENIPAIDYYITEKTTTTKDLQTGEELLNSTTMTVPNGTSISNTSEEEEEPIYQPIWKFKTVGEVRENYITDEYYDHLERTCDSSASIPGVDIEDHDEWEPDDEFTFTTKLDGSTKEPDTLSVNTTQSSSGSTITGYASSVSTMTIASTSSVTHHIFRNICIFYSLKEPKIHAVLYEYDRNRCSSYFAQQPQPQPQSSIKSSGWGGTDSLPATTSADNLKPSNEYNCERNKLNKRSGESGGRMFPDSVLAWKYMLLDVNYLEDEEDMIVSESQILKAQSIKEMDITPPSVGVLQRFKSVSSGNLLDVPAEEDKKSITERVRNKLQRGVFKLQTRSPKENKKGRNLFRRNEATSLYLEDGMKPKYPIFKAPLELLEMNETVYPDVPRFVVDCIDYIEQKDCIQMDGLYRASGNKVAIDELKQKLTESYIYDPKLLVTDDIHTLTSLLKLFFRELGSPLIPQDTYQRLSSTRNLMDPAAVESMKIVFQDMKNPNRATLKFLIKHLTTVAHYSSENRMPASNLAIVWGPCILSANQIEYDIARMNTLAKVLIENYDKIFGDNERLVS